MKLSTGAFALKEPNIVPSWISLLERNGITITSKKLAYSPDLNPIELAFSKFKKMLRDGAERTVDKLWKLCGTILSEFTEAECRDYFQHCGYRYS